MTGVSGRERLRATTAVAVAAVALAMVGPSNTLHATQAGPEHGAMTQDVRGMLAPSPPSTQPRTHPLYPVRVPHGPAVVLVPGWNSTNASMQRLGARIEADTNVRVFYANVGDMTGPLGDTAANVTRLVRYLDAVGYAPLSLVGLSAGGLVARASAEHVPAIVHRLIVVGAPLRGVDLTRSSHIRPVRCAASAACQDLHPRSVFAKRLRARPLPVRTIAIVSPHDTVVPARSSVPDEAVRVDISRVCPTAGRLAHADLIHADETQDLVIAALTGAALTCAAHT